MTKLPLIASLLTITALLPAQTQTVRGGVEDVQNTQNQFFLDCTTIPVVSTALNLNLWTTEAILQVVNIGTVTSPILRVDSAVATAKIFDMGNLRFNQSNRWEVNAPAGSFAIVFIDFTWNTGYTPFGSAGTYLLGQGAPALRSGFANAQNQFEFNYMIPNLPQYTGISVSGQALVVSGGNVFFSNPDCKEIGN